MSLYGRVRVSENLYSRIFYAVKADLGLYETKCFVKTAYCDNNDDGDGNSDNNYDNSINRNNNITKSIKDNLHLSNFS